MDSYHRMHRPAYSTLLSSSSTSTSSSTSPTSFDSPLPAELPSMSAVTSTHLQPSAVPLPSPTSQQPTQYFGSLHGHSQQPQQQAVFQHQQLQAQRPHYQQQQMPHQQRQSSYDYQPERAGAGATAQDTMNMLSNANLIAEAAKRAQMHVLVRDLEDLDMS